MGIFSSLFGRLAPGTALVSTKPGDVATGTFRRFGRGFQLPQPTYHEHLVDPVDTRERYDSQALIQHMFQHDPDTSAAVNGYLALANTDMIAYAVDLKGEPDLKQSYLVHQDLDRITRQVDYTQGFTFKQSKKQLDENLRYCNLMRGAAGAELILDDGGKPTDIRLCDMASIRWFEPTSGNYKPTQRQEGEAPLVSLDIPTFFVVFYRRDPGSIYSKSPFVAAINTIVARTGILNDLYRIMKINGFQRLDIEILEKVVKENAPANIQADADALKSWISQQMSAIAVQVADMSSDQAFVHPDTIKAKILNEKPQTGINMDSVIKVLNDQIQAGLKTMSTILGRGGAGANTGSVEARMAAMYADELNEPLVDFWQKVLSFLAHQRGYKGYVKVKYAPAELRPETELEPQRTMKSIRLRQDLSDGFITDFEYHLWMYGRLPPESAPKEQGTKFLLEVPQGSQEGPDPANISPNTDPLGRSITPGGAKATKQNMPKQKAKKTSQQQLVSLLLAHYADEGDES